MTVEEPAQEPDASAPAREERANRLSLWLEEIMGDEASSEEPASNVPRTTEEPPAENSAASASSTRAPGTPITSLMRTVQRNQPVSPGPAEAPGNPERERSLRRSEVHEESDEDSLLTYDEAVAGYVFLAKRNDEISLKDLNAEEKKLFNESDELEWNSILKTKAVRVVTGREADYVREKMGSRIISSRMVRRRKPLEKLGSWKAKSRWCLHGHSDPDTGSLVTYAPTPQWNLS